MTVEREETGRAEVATEEDLGYQKALGPRQIQMIAIGGAIGTGLFMGAGGRLQQAGPALVLVYALCGFFACLILRALGELVMHRPTSGSFVSYAREFFGEKMAFAAGWLYWMNWAMTAVVDVTAVALYMNFFKKYWAPLGHIDQWMFALIAVLLVLGLNLVSVKVFGELEFWFALIKVVALTAFLGFGVYFVLFGTPIEGHSSGFSLIADNGGLFPNGILPAVVVIQGVVFAYAAIEMVGIAAGENILRDLRIVNAVGGDQRDRHRALQLASDPAESSARYRRGDGRNARFVPADPGVDDGRSRRFNRFGQFSDFRQRAAVVDQIEHRQTVDDNEIVTGALSHGLDHFNGESHTARVIAAPLIAALVSARGEEFVNQIAF